MPVPTVFCVLLPSDSDEERMENVGIIPISVDGCVDSGANHEYVADNLLSLEEVTTNCILVIVMYCKVGR